MSVESSARATAQRSASADAGPCAGVFRIDAGRVSWSDQVFVIHGFAPGEVRPTTGLWLAHVVEADRAAVERALTSPTPRASSVPYGLRDARGAVRRCVLVAVPAAGGLEGYLVDLTDEWRASASARATAVIREEVQVCAPVEQAVGMVMAESGVDAAGAASMLRERAGRRGQELPACARDVLSAGGLGPRGRGAGSAGRLS